ncbi:MAG: sulfotransferase family protein [Rhizomicrobium sp.]
MAVTLNLTWRAWRQLRRAWRLPRTASLTAEAWGLAPLRSLIAVVQNLVVGRASMGDAEAIFVLGFWRSGTTLMHELLAADERFCFPTNYACFHPHHFIFTHKSARALKPGRVRRPQDGMTTGWQTPQEDEFALLCLGARSPYEGLIAAGDFDKSLALADPEDLGPKDRRTWEKTFLKFFRSVRFAHGDRPMVLKSPPHSYRVRTLRKLLPKSRFILMVRDPAQVFESMMKTYRAFSLRYGLVPGLPNRELRELILKERLRCEEKLICGLAGLGEDRLALVKFEDLIADPAATVKTLYRQFRLGGFEERRIRQLPRPQPAALPPEEWQERLSSAWSSLFARYGYRPPYPKTGIAEQFQEQYKAVFRASAKE